MNVSLPQLKAFAAVARHRSFTRAAAELGLTQSAVSRSVRELEEEIDLRLFDRTTRQVELTEAGTLLSERICHLIDEVEQTLHETHSSARPAHGRVQLAVAPMLSSMLAPAWLQACQSAWPDIDIVLRDVGPEAALHAVRGGEVDFAVVSDPEPCAELQFDPLYEETFHAVLPTGHPLASREALGWGDLNDAQLFGLDRQSGMLAAIERAMAAYHVRPRVYRPLGHFCAVLGMVARRQGLGVVPSRARAAGVPPGVVLLPLRPHAAMQVVLVRRKGRSLKPNAAAIWRVITEQEGPDVALKTG
ncbi:LysR family transcriptional regulator [Cupriavidus gilardii]|uniref:LysR family transcriptional regulator n=1 Tax=Cupriavidus gilardii TaxID=82541 RepID=UPI0007E4CEF0|nr:LysR family transcriptional regulator [Cupriavidus gilardii]